MLHKFHDKQILLEYFRLSGSTNCRKLRLVEIRRCYGVVKPHRPQPLQLHCLLTYYFWGRHVTLSKYNMAMPVTTTWGCYYLYFDVFILIYSLTSLSVSRWNWVIRIVFQVFNNLGSRLQDLGHHKVFLFRLDASDTWALHKILRIPYTCHVSNTEVRRTTGCSPLSHLVTNRRLQLFGHIACSSSREDHHRALAACIRHVSPDWKQRAGRPSHTWFRAIETNLGSLNFGLATAWRKATTRDEWRHIVDAATLQRSML